MLRLSSDYDYRDSSDTYRESSDEDTVFSLNVVGCTGTPGTPGTPITGRIAAITASLGSDATVGQELVVTSTITNLKDTTAEFLVGASGFESWASLDSISPRILSLAAGESRSVTLSFNVDEDASGSESFTIEVQSGSDLETREVEVSIQEESGTGGFNFGGDNTLIWVIGAINVILIILIIIVAIRISSR